MRRWAGSLMVSPVGGLWPKRALRRTSTNLPKPGDQGQRFLINLQFLMVEEVIHSD